MGKKKFIDKKKAATFQLLARDSSDPHYNQTPGSDRLFVRVDNNQYSTSSFFDDGDSCPIDEDPNSKFADADEDDGEYDFDGDFGTSVTFGKGFEGTPGETSLPEDVRREILELGFPDDGYNYLIHLREIRGIGGGSNYYANPKAKLEELPRDVKAYDASRVHISTPDNVDMDDKSMYRLASKAVGVKVQKVLDPEVAAFLDDSDMSRFGSDVEDLEEDFVVRANQQEERGYLDTNGDTDLMNGSKVINLMSSGTSISECPETDAHRVHVAEEEGRFTKKAGNDNINKTKRCPRALDEQFDLLVHEEYETDNEEDEYGCYNSEEDKSLAAELKHAFGDQDTNDLGLDEDYKTPADFLKGKERPKTSELEAAADIVHRCAEYAKKYENEDESEDDVVVQASSDESEEWDCETIVSTYSNLDNHPGKIETPGGTARRKKLSATVTGALNASGPVISLRGREKLPVDFLPHGRKSNLEKPKSIPNAKLEQPKRKQHGQESKEEKKERKASVKEEKREARRMKKEMKGLYRGEAQRAQRVAAVSGPSSIHLM